MEIKKLEHNNYEEWDRFCLESDDAWFWHTSKWLEYTLNYNPKLKPLSKSFFIVNNKKILAICPLILEKSNDIKEFSYGGSYGIIPAFANDLTKKQRKKIEKLAFREIDKLAKENEVKRISMRFSPLSNSFIKSERLFSNYLMKYGYNDISINTQIIDLKKSIEKLRLDIRHGHDSDIDKASKFLKAEIFDKTNISRDSFRNYIEMHHKAAGKSTRPDVTFDMMHNWIKKGMGFLIGVKKNGNFVGFSYFNAYKNNVYYSSSCNEPSETLPIAHFIQWVAIKWMNEKKYHFYEIGWQEYSNTLAHFPSKKEVDIGRFKRGFGGFVVPLFIGEKFFDRDYFLKINKERIKKYVNELDGGK